MPRKVYEIDENGRMSYYLKTTEVDRNAARKAIASGRAERKMIRNWYRAGGRPEFWLHVHNFFRPPRPVTTVAIAQRRQKPDPFTEHMARRLAGISLHPQGSNLD